MTQIQETQDIGRGMTFDGQKVTIRRHILSGPIAPGASETEYFSVDAGATGSFGFLSLDEAERFLTSDDDQEYGTIDAYGTPGTDVRRGLGIASGMLQLNRPNQQPGTVVPAGEVDTDLDTPDGGSHTATARTDARSAVDGDPQPS